MISIFHAKMQVELEEISHRTSKKTRTEANCKAGIERQWDTEFIVIDSDVADGIGNVNYF